jgi:ppGpp synthetase/RelA/SpoT-type nucleotidyltranferase
MNFEEFIRDGRPRYDLFAKTVASVLHAAIDSEPRVFRLQQITSRAKDHLSLKRKLTERGLLESGSIERELKDLAGCRLVFYTDTDVDRFLDSRIIFKNFFVDFDGTRIHHSVGVDRLADQLYFGIHYLVSLSNERLSLPEYAQFRTMRCEVQIQTILHHAWAETSHDIVYHPAPLQGFGTRQFADIKKRLEKIMNRYLLPAGYEFQKVQHDYERLLAGKELFDRGTLEALEAATDNNERHEQLKRIRENLLPFYDDVSAVALEVIRLAAEAIKKARDTPPIPVKTAFGDFDGCTAEQVASEALQLIDDLRYAEIERTFDVLCDLYLTARSNDERKRIFQSFEALARHDMDAWKQVDFGVQKALHDAVRSLPEAKRQALRPVITGMCELFLSAELEGATWHFNSVSLTRAAVTPSTAYKEFRNGVLEVLFDLYRTATSSNEKLQVEEALSSGTCFPMDGGHEDLIAIVLDNTQQVVQYFADSVDHEPFDVLQHIEHKFLWLYRRSKEMAGGKGGSVIPEKAQAVVSAIESFRDRANKNDRFVKFKTLVGFESVFPLEWDNDGMDIEGPRRYRDAKIKEYAASVTADNAMNGWE